MAGRYNGCRVNLASRRGGVVIAIYGAFGRQPWTHADVAARGVGLAPSTIASLAAGGTIVRDNPGERPRMWRLADRVVEGIAAGRCIV